MFFLIFSSLIAISAFIFFRLNKSAKVTELKETLLDLGTIFKKLFLTLVKIFVLIKELLPKAPNNEKIRVASEEKAEEELEGSEVVSEEKSEEELEGSEVVSEEKAEDDLEVA